MHFDALPTPSPALEEENSVDSKPITLWESLPPQEIETHDGSDHLPSIVFKGPHTLNTDLSDAASSEMMAFQQAREEFKNLQDHSDHMDNSIQMEDEETTPPPSSPSFTSSSVSPSSSFLNQTVEAVVAETQAQIQEQLQSTSSDLNPASPHLDSDEVQALIKEIAWSIIPTVAERILRQEILKELDL